LIGIGSFDLAQHPVERRPIEQLAVDNDRVDTRRVADVLQRIGVQQDKICDLALRDGAEIL
jgi:hypothetical protein